MWRTAGQAVANARRRQAYLAISEQCSAAAVFGKSSCERVCSVERAQGISIRFPRLVRLRDDKAPEEATTAEQVAEMFSAQVAAVCLSGRQLRGRFGFGPHASGEKKVI
jgi:hypothetical protein